MGSWSTVHFAFYPLAVIRVTLYYGEQIGWLAVVYGLFMLIAREALTVIAERHSATINQFVGDGIMIFFGAPQATSDHDHAQRAVRMALDMQARMQHLKDAWIDRGVRKPFRARIGINTGYASVGDYGSPGRKVYSAIGIQTHLAARIQVHCEPGKILISDTTWALVREDFACTDKGEFQFKGLHYPVRVYEVSGSPHPATAAMPISATVD